MKLPATLMAALSSARLRVGRTRPSGGEGQHASREKRPQGIEFESYRPFQTGDDVRHLDTRLRARFGRDFVKEYRSLQQARVTILIDASASMGVGAPTKLHRAAEIALTVAFVALRGGDLVRIAGYSGRHLAVSKYVQGVARLSGLGRVAARLRPAGDGFEDALGQLRATPGYGRTLVVAVSDWMIGPFERQLSALAQQGADIVCIHVVGHEDEAPSFGSGTIELLDAETGEKVEITATAELIERYGAAFRAWTDEVKAGVLRSRARYLAISTAADLAATMAADWRRDGLFH